MPDSYSAIRRIFLNARPSLALGSTLLSFLRLTPIALTTSCICPASLFLVTCSLVLVLPLAGLDLSALFALSFISGLPVVVWVHDCT